MPENSSGGYFPICIRKTLLQIPAGRGDCPFSFSDNFLLFPRFYRINSRTLWLCYECFVLRFNDEVKYSQPISNRLKDKFPVRSQD